MSYEKPKQWQNFGDVNPEKHGGLFVKWNGNGWKVIRTTHPEDLPEGFSQYHFEIMWINETEAFIEGNPGYGFTQEMIDSFKEVSNKPFQLLRSDELPEGEDWANYMHEIVEKHGEWLIGNFAQYKMAYHGGSEQELSPNYWGYLERHGIDKEEF